MILVDTNVLSAVLGLTEQLEARRWLDAQAPDELWTSTVTVFEIRTGLLRMPLGRRRGFLTTKFDALLAAGLDRRIAPVDFAAATAAAELDAARKAGGLNIDLADTLIAGIALSRRATIATRNLRHFADLDTPVVDPWTA